MQSTTSFIGSSKTVTLGSLFLFLGIFIAACSSSGGHTVSLRLVSDYAVPGEAAQAVSTLDDATSEPGVQTYALSANDSIIRGAVVAKFENVGSGSHAFSVTLMRADGTQLASRPVVAQITRDATITVVVSASCENVQCPGAGESATHIACFGGQCVDPRCTPETLDYCGDITICHNDNECAGQNASECALSRCVQGACVAPPDDRKCESNEQCVRTEGCKSADVADGGVTQQDGGDTADAALDATIDAALLDASIVDASFIDAVLADVTLIDAWTADVALVDGSRVDATVDMSVYIDAFTSMDMLVDAAADAPPDAPEITMDMALPDSALTPDAFTADAFRSDGSTDAAPALLIFSGYAVGSSTWLPGYGEGGYIDFDVFCNQVPTAEATVTFETNLPDDVTFSPASMTFNGSCTSQRLRINIVDDSLVEGPEGLTVNLMLSVDDARFRQGLQSQIVSWPDIIDND